MKPDTYSKRSPVYRQLALLEADWNEINCYSIVKSIKQYDSHSSLHNKLTLADVSAISRIGFKGKGAYNWLLQQNINLPDKVNTARPQSNGCLVARLDQEEFLILDNYIHYIDTVNSLQESWSNHGGKGGQTKGFIVPRQDSHACFLISGADSTELFTRLCAVDFRPHKFNNHHIAQTSLARVCVVIMRHDLEHLLSFIILVDSTFAEYLWMVLVEAMQEFDGRHVGVEQLRNFKSVTT